MKNTAAVERKQIHVSILGSCVSRDAFSLTQGTEAGADFTVDRFVQSIHPLSAISAPVDRVLSEKLLALSLDARTSNFYKRNFKLDLTKGWEAYLSEVKSEWLILDLSVVRLDLRPIGETYVTHELELTATKGLDESGTPEIAALREKALKEACEMSDEELRPILAKYFKRILALYPAKRIIVLDVRHVYTYIDPVEKTVATPSAMLDRRYRNEDRVIDIAYTYAKEYLRDAHFVDALPLRVGNVRHVWGRCGLHYLDEAYLYFRRAIERITDPHASRRALTHDLSALRLSFSEKIFALYADASNRTAEGRANLLAPNEGLLAGVYEKNGLTVTVDTNRHYTVKGTAREDTAIYLCTLHGTPFGTWAPLPVSLPEGIYRLTTDVEAAPDRISVHLITTDREGKQRWLAVDVSRKLPLNGEPASVLVRMIVKKGSCVCLEGRMVFERLE